MAKTLGVIALVSLAGYLTYTPPPMVELYTRELNELNSQDVPDRLEMATLRARMDTRKARKDELLKLISQTNPDYGASKNP